jgi:transposase
VVWLERLWRSQQNSRSTNWRQSGAIAKTTTVREFERKRAERQTFPEHVPRERVVINPPTACECCGSNRLRKLGEDVTRTLESVPRQWKVIDTVREKFSCRDCDKISRAPAPFHAVARGWAGPSLPAMIMFEKFGQHQPLNRQAERYALEGVPIALSTMADAVGSVCTALDPLPRLLEAHVMAAERLHVDDTTVPMLAKGDRYGTMLVLRTRRQSFWWDGSAGGDVLLLARPKRRVAGRRAERRTF